MFLIYFVHKNGKEYIGESETPALPHFATANLVLRRARTVSYIDIPMNNAQGGITVQNKLVMRPICLSDSRVDTLNFTWNDVMDGLVGTPSQLAMRAYAEATQPPQPQRMPVPPESQIQKDSKDSKDQKPEQPAAPADDR